MSAREVEAVMAWHEAPNAGDAERLVSLSHPDVALEGPRGAVRGRDALRGWAARANVRLEPGRRFGRAVVVEEAATWRNGATGEKTGEATVATVFAVEGGLVSSLARHDGVEGALERAGLGAEDEIHAE